MYRLPGLLLLDSEGNEVSLREYSGKVAVVDVWASWCIPCEKAVPVIEELRNRTDENFVYLGINTDQDKSPEEVAAKAKALGMQYKTLLDPHHVFVDLFRIEGLPAFLVFSRSGQLIYRQYGLTEGDLEGLTARISAWKSIQ
jgi:thiol-disulfide isomerase/thioredoxin